MTFRGWPSEALEFYEGLEADNSKSYWTAHKQVYDEQVLAPMVELLAELEPEFGAGKIFRPYRDVRFSADKTPYKTAIAASLGEGYVQLSSRGLAAGAGMYMMSRDQLQRYRDAVADDITGPQLERAIAAVRRKRIEVTGHDTLRTAPRGYPKEHPRVELLRHKGVITWKEWEVAPWLGTAEPRKRVAGFLRSSRPLQDWLTEHVGPASS